MVWSDERNVAATKKSVKNNNIVRFCWRRVVVFDLYNDAVVVALVIPFRVFFVVMVRKRRKIPFFVKDYH